MINKITALLIALLFSLNTNAQSVLLERDLSESVYVKKKGPNKSRFMHLYYDFASYYTAGQKDVAFEDGSSFRSYIGIRNYYRLANSYIMGFGLELGWENFNVKKDATVFSFENHDKERIGTTNLGVDYFNRILITQRESSLGYWIDAGAYLNYNLGSRYVTKDKLPSGMGFRTQKEIYKGVDFLNKWEYGLKAKLGYKRYAVVGTYRLSSWFSDASSLFEPQKFSIGFELGMY